ncbi:DedA family protein [Burkholderiales bacterium]|nr:DedA family protein [Burkholderiales bacterium]
MEGASLLGLFVASFLSATVLPGSSEVVFITMLLHEVSSKWTALWVATIGNTLGGITTFFFGRLLPIYRLPSKRILASVRRWGGVSLLFSWVPLLGDAVCLAAGLLRTHLLLSIGCIALGKFVRYWILMVGLT